MLATYVDILSTLCCYHCLVSIFFGIVISTMTLILITFFITCILHIT